MSLILHIDTATEYGAVAISDSDLIIAVDENNNQKEHASFLHPAINLVVKKAGVSLEEIEAISVTIGPGSYTGLRVGLTAAKGLCFVLRKPLITVDTLKAMALASIENSDLIEPVLFAPMIDARRMEVYTGLYTSNADLYRAAQALILSDDIFAEEMKEYSIVFSGNGSKKMQTAFNNDKFLFIDAIHNIRHIINIAYKQFIKKKFEDPAYCEPIYLKPFYTTAIVKK